MTKSLYRLKLYISQHGVLVVSIVVSIILHIFLIVEFAFNLPELFEGRQILNAKLISIQPVKPLSPVAVAEAPPPLQTKQPDPEITAADSPPEPNAGSASTLIADAVDEKDTILDNLSSATLNMSPSTISTASKGNSDDQSIVAVEKSLDTEPEKTPYTHVETEFEVRRGLDTSTAGITKITFNIDNNGAYSIYSLTQAKGLASLFFGNLVQKSDGNVTNSGLRPEFYSYQYGNDEKKLQNASFHWNGGVLKLHSSRGDNSVQLREGTQDFLSFMYQFMFTPPLNNMQISMTNGKKLDTYYYSFEGEETINCKLGEIRTIHLLKGGFEDEKTEIWLATDYQYLPVKIRKTDKDGTTIEQLATRLSTN